MILIGGNALDITTLNTEFGEGTVEQALLQAMNTSTGKYEYSTLDELRFELILRREIVNAANALNGSGLDFSTFEESRVNEALWERTPNGGFLKKKEASSAAAIEDIYKNGSSYATECATAMLIVYYGALLEVFGQAQFDALFPDIYLMDWDVRDPLLRGVSIPLPREDILLGDRGYFRNPEVNPDTPEWQGENVIVLPDSLYYGHGIGIADATTMIAALNAQRKEGATQSAFMETSTGRPNFKRLARLYYSGMRQPAALVWKPFPAPLYAV